MARSAARYLALALVFMLAACGGPTLTGVGSVEILGGDRNVPLTATTLLTPLVTAGGGVATTVSWSSSDETVATVDAAGLVATHTLGTTDVTATSTADPSKSDTVTIAVVPPSIADDAFMATVTTGPGAPPAMGAGLLLVDPLVVSAVRAMSGVVDLGDGFYGGSVSPVDSEDGTVVIRLPAAADVPSQVLVAADEFVYNVSAIPNCSLVASDPTARVSFSAFELVSFPGVLVYTADGAMFGLVTSKPVDPADPVTPAWAEDASFYTWAFADKPVSVSSSGAGCASASLPLSVDVDLQQGWNRLAWTVDVDLVADTFTGINLGNSDGEGETYVFPMFGGS